MPPSISSTAPPERTLDTPPGGILGAIYAVISFVLEEGIHLWVRVTGKRVRISDSPWLAAPLGERGRIGVGIYERIAAAEGLQIRMQADAGLIPDFEALRGPSFDPDTIRSEIQHFYEHAAQYHLDVWSEVSLVGRFFLWLLVEFISRRMDQMNFPISSLEVSKGMSSQVVQLIEPASGKIAYTGWLRRLKSSGLVIYAGLYSTVNVPGEENPCVKVTFPCRGSANVYLGDLCVRYVKTLHELFYVYVDNENVLRVDHTISFLGLVILRLHYKMTLLTPQVGDGL
jgi:hypothetical protein